MMTKDARIALIFRWPRSLIANDELPTSLILNWVNLNLGARIAFRMNRSLMRIMCLEYRNACKKKGRECGCKCEPIDTPESAGTLRRKAYIAYGHVTLPITPLFARDSRRTGPTRATARRRCPS